MDELAGVEADVRLAQQAATLAPELRLADSHHEHEGGYVVKHRGQKTVLIVFQPLPVNITQRLVPEGERGGDTGREGGRGRGEEREICCEASWPEDGPHRVPTASGQHHPETCT